MGVVRNVKFEITGQVPDDHFDNDYILLLNKLKTICAEYDLNLEEVSDLEEMF